MLGIEVVADHQHVEVLVDGVDRVRAASGWCDDGSTFGSPQARDDVGRVAAAGALGVVGVDGAALERGDRVLDEARLVQRVGVDRDLHVVARRRRARQLSIAAGVVPQSSCSFRPMAPASICSSSALGQAGVALAEEAEVHRAARRRPAACGAMFQGPGVQVVALVPVAGPGAAADHRGDAADISASSICCGQMKWMCASMPPAVTISPSPAMTSVPGPMTMSTPGWTSGLPALPMPTMRPSLMPMSALTMPQWSTISALVMTVSTTSACAALALAHAVADDLAAAELHLLAVDGAVALDLDDQLGVGQAHAVAGGRAVHLGVGAARRCSSRLAPSVPMTFAVEAVDRARRRRRRPARPSRSCPGSKRTAVPAAMFEPKAARRLRGRSAARGWSRRSGSASRPGSAGRRCWRHVDRDASRGPALSSISPSRSQDFAGDHGVGLLTESGGGR